MGRHEELTGQVVLSSADKEDWRLALRTARFLRVDVVTSKGAPCGGVRVFLMMIIPDWGAFPQDNQLTDRETGRAQFLMLAEGQQPDENAKHRASRRPSLVFGPIVEEDPQGRLEDAPVPALR